MTCISDLHFSFDSPTYRTNAVNIPFGFLERDHMSFQTRFFSLLILCICNSSTGSNDMRDNYGRKKCDVISRYQNQRVLNHVWFDEAFHRQRQFQEMKKVARAARFRMIRKVSFVLVFSVQTLEKQVFLWKNFPKFFLRNHEENFPKFFLMISQCFRGNRIGQQMVKLYFSEEVFPLLEIKNCPVIIFGVYLSLSF